MQLAPDDDAGPRRQWATWHRDSPALLGFGGYDGRRLSSVARRADPDAPWTVVDQFDRQVAPPPLQHHRAVIWRRSLVVIGGRTRPLAASGLYVLDLDTWRWRCPAADGPEPRYRHALAHDPDGGRIFVHGGIGSGGRLLGDLWVLDLEAFSWRLLSESGAPPSGRHSHSLTWCGGRLLLFGGLTDLGAGRATNSAIYEYDLEQNKWRKLTACGDPPPPIYSHVAVAVADAFMIVIGGVATAAVWAPPLYLFNNASMTWLRADADALERLRLARLLIGHGVVPGPGPDRITIIGGAATCFSFGRWADAPVVLDLPELFDIR